MNPSPTDEAGRSIFRLFNAAVADSADHEAVIDPPNRRSLCFGEPRRITWAALDDLSARMASVLAAEGVAHGTIVLAQLPNIHELVALYLAVARLGAVISPIPMQYGRHEISGIASTAQPVLSVTVDGFKDATPAVEHRAVLPEATPVLTLGDNAPEGTLAFSRLIAEASPLDATAEVVAEDLFTLCWTSGTTGTPKGVPRRHRHWVDMLPVFEDATPLPQHAALLAPFPMVNMAALSVFLVYWLSLRGKLILHHPLDLAVFLTQAQNEKAVFTVAPPALLNMLLGQPDLLGKFDLSSLRVIGSGSAPLSPWMIEGFKRELGIDVINMFGSNEGVCLISDANEVPDPEARAVFFPRFGSDNHPWRNRMSKMLRTKLIDPETGETIDRKGLEGELLIKGPTVFEGYLGADNDELFDDEGFFRTGDLFELDGDNGEFLRFAGRCKDIIIRGGMKISPEELDGILIGHPDIADVATFGREDARLGQTVAAAIVPAADDAPTVEALADWLKQAGVANFKYPESVHRVDSLPRNPLGKVVRQQLAEQLA